jgi:hypothetical protein
MEKQGAFAIKPDHRQIIEHHLVPDESLLDAFDCIGVPTGFAGLTDARLIISTKDNTILSLPYDRMPMIAYDPGGRLSNDKIKNYLPQHKKLELSLASQSTMLFVYRLLMSALLGKSPPSARQAGRSRT